MRNYSIDTFRLVAAFAVVFEHVINGAMPSDVENNLRLLFRFCVPFFFMASGYFFYKNFVERGNEQFEITLKRLAGIFIIAWLIYLPLDFWYHTFRFDYSLILTGTSFHLWFIPSIIIGFIVCRINLAYPKSDAFFCVLSVVLILMNLFSDSYIGLFNVGISSDFTRLFLSIPYLFAGIKIAQKNITLSNTSSIVLIVAGLIIQFAESIFLFNKFNINVREIQFLIGTVPLSLGVFFLSFKAWPNKTLAGYGQKISLAIYLYHPLVFALLLKVITVVFSSASKYILCFSSVITFFTTLFIFIILDKYLPRLFAILNGHLKKESR